MCGKFISTPEGVKVIKYQTKIITDKNINFSKKQYLKKNEELS